MWKIIDQIPEIRDNIKDKGLYDTIINVKVPCFIFIGFDCAIAEDAANNELNNNDIGELNKKYMLDSKKY